ncbi:MAG: polyprenyl synthetase family protein [Candidatus Micrarchaeota archaeon]
MADVLETLRQKSLLVDEQLKQLLPPAEGQAIPEVRELYSSAWDYNLRGGKRLRPALCLLSCEAFGGNPQDALNTAAALELLQNFLLIHDDIEDASDMRRGKPCLNKLHGDAFAINSGDFVHAWMWRCLLANKPVLGATKTFAVMREFVQQLETTAEGQAMEIAWVRDGKWDVSEEDYFELVKRKTANYTITRPLRLGAIIAGATKRQADSLNAAGEKLGIAFQIQDDILNLAPPGEAYGKETAGDLYEGKRTLILSRALSKMKDAERGEALASLSKPRAQKTPEEMARVLELVKKTGALDYCRKKARQLASQAREQLSKKLFGLPDSQAKSDIFALVDFIVEREY